MSHPQVGTAAGPTHRPDADAPFRLTEWGLMAGLAGTWGASFFLIAVALDDFPPAAIAFLRIALGAGTLALIPAARRPLPREAWRGVLPLGVVQIGAPLMLFPIAQQFVSSSFAGMMNGTVPIVTAAVAMVIARALPPHNQRVGLAVGFAGVIAISSPTLDASATAFGAGLLAAAVLSYAVAINIAAPLQRAHGALPVIFRAEVVGLVVTAPFGLPVLMDSSPSAASVASLLILGCLGTGLAFAALTTLAGRVGATRGSVAVYLTPAVAIVLGVVVLGEAVVPLQILGTALAVAGAWLTSRPRRQSHVGGDPPAALIGSRVDH